MISSGGEMNLERMRGLHQGKSFAVIGSGPSALMYAGHEDVGIGVNAAAQLLKGGGYFVSMYKAIQFRSFFEQIPLDLNWVLRPHSAIYSKAFYSDDVRNQLIQVNCDYMEKHPEQTQVVNGFRYVSKEYEYMPEFVDSMPGHEKHLLVRHVQDDIEISRFQPVLTQQGTSSSTAIQLAFILGAAEIHLYGVEFSHDASFLHKENKNQYFYRPAPGEAGRPVLEKHKRDIERVISAITGQGCPVYSHGPTRISNTIRLPSSERQ